jgi:formimidoylglutamate deiminase
MTIGVFSLWFETALLPQGWADRVRIEIADGLIAAVSPGVDPAPADERRATGLPGLCNVHSHAFQRGMAGLTEHRGAGHDDFWSWRELMYRFLDRLTPDDVQAISALAFTEMLESGFTRVGEFHYLHHDPDGRPYANLAEMAERIVAAAAETGIGLTLLPVYYRQGGFGGAPAAPGQRRFLNDTDRFARMTDASRRAIAELPDANLGVAPHSLRAVSPEDLRAILPLADGGPVHIHAAEQVKEVRDCLAWSGRRPVAWLLDEAGVDGRWCLIHATHLTAEETARLAASGAVAGLCPITEANLGDGVFPARAYLGHGGAFGVGTDSNVAIDAAQELRMLEYAQRLTERARNVLAEPDADSTGVRLFRAAVQGGAQALGQTRVGLRPGAPADIVSLRNDEVLAESPRRDARIDGWVFADGRSAIDRVWRRGRQVVEDGRHCGRATLVAAYRQTLRRLLAT